MAKETKDHLLRSTIALIMEDGLEKLTINKVIKKAGSSKGAFYYYFSNIDDLMKATFIYALNNSLIEFTYNPDVSFQQNIHLFGKYLIKVSKHKAPEQSILFLWISKCYQDEYYQKQFQAIRKEIVEQNTLSKELQISFDIETEALYMLDIVIIGFLVHCLLHAEEEVLLSIWDQLTSQIIQSKEN